MPVAVEPFSLNHETIATTCPDTADVKWMTLDTYKPISRFDHLKTLNDFNESIFHQRKVTEIGNRPDPHRSF